MPHDFRYTVRLTEEQALWLAGSARILQLEPREVAEALIQAYIDACIASRDEKQKREQHQQAPAEDGGA